MNHAQGRVALLVDCDNANPAILDYALGVAEQFGRAILRRGYGSHATLGSKWQEALVSQGFTPHLQYAYAPGKNTADIALALDALELMFDGRADTFCLVTSDSDFAYLCRKLHERGAAVYIIGENKSPAALRNASDRFFEWVEADRADIQPASKAAASPKGVTSPTDIPAFVIDAVRHLSSSASGGKVDLSALGNHLKQSNPGFSTSSYGFSKLINMLKSSEKLILKKEDNGAHTVRLGTAAHGRT